MSVCQEEEETAGHIKPAGFPAADCSTRKNKDMTDDMSSRHSDVRPQIERPPSPVPSCVSMKSDRSMDYPPKFSSKPLDLNKLKADLTQNPCRCAMSVDECGPPADQACPDCENTCGTQPPLQPLLDDEHMDMAGNRHRHSEHISVRRSNIDCEVLQRVVDTHKSCLKRRFKNISESIDIPGTQIHLNEIYTELYITEGESDGVNKEHEVWQVESASRAQTSEDTPINCNDMFKLLPGQERHIRTVMTKGIAGIGKTISVQKFILDWTDGVANHDVDFMFPLSFRALNLIRDDEYSLHQLLLDFHPELQELEDGEKYKDCQVVFIFDGLDESRILLRFQKEMSVSDVQQTSSVDVLITSLIQGSLLPSALIWITSRPAAASQIPTQYIDQVTEVRGFNDPQKEEYFMKRIGDESQAIKIISHIKSSRSLHIMCHIPVFCWISTTVFQRLLEHDNTQEIPKTLTGMFVHLLLLQMTRKYQKYQSGSHTNKEKLLESQREMILKLAQLAFKNLENGNLMFYEDDLKECGIDVSEASVYSGMCTEIFKEESVFHQKKVYCFVHLTIQEFLAALYVFVSYSYQIETMGAFFSLEDSLKLAVTKTLDSRNGHLDLFLRFLLGICLERNQKLLKGLLKHTRSNLNSIKKICQYIKELNKEDLSPERCISLLQCLSEVNDTSMHGEIQYYLRSPKGFKNILSPAHCSVLAHMLLMSEEVLDEFDLKNYNTSDEGRRGLIPAVRCFSIAKLQGCNLNKMSCDSVKRCLQSANPLIHLDLSCNPLEDSGVQVLSAGLTSPHCKLQTLRLADCKITDKSSEIMASVLQSPNSLIELDLSHNDLGNSGVQLLSEGLANPDCKLQTLRLSGCLISEEGCGFLDSALISNPYHLKELDLSYNHPGKSGLLVLSARLENPCCKLETLQMDYCAEIRLRPGARRYPCTLTLDQNTANTSLSLSERNRKVCCVREEQPYPDHPERFDYWFQVLCREGLSGRCYWEAEWSGGGVDIAVAYRSIKREGWNDDSYLGRNDKSWKLYCSSQSYTTWHNNKSIDIPAPSSGSRRVGVYLDWPAGTLSFYSVSSDTLTHLHTFHSTFTEPLYPGFYVWPNSSVSLCPIT